MYGLKRLGTRTKVHNSSLQLAIFLGQRRSKRVYVEKFFFYEKCSEKVQHKIGRVQEQDKTIVCPNVYDFMHMRNHFVQQSKTVVQFAAIKCWLPFGVHRGLVSRRRH